MRTGCGGEGPSCSVRARGIDSGSSDARVSSSRKLDLRFASLRLALDA
jgi:hypothetical protein